MTQMINANFRLEKNKHDIIKNLVATGTYDSLTTFFRTAVDEHLSKYTDIPTLLSLDRKVKLNKAQIDKLNEEKRNLNRRVTEIEKELESSRG